MMKPRKITGSILLAMGCAVILLGILSTVLPSRNGQYLSFLAFLQESREYWAAAVINACLASLLQNNIELITLGIVLVMIAMLMLLSTRNGLV